MFYDEKVKSFEGFLNEERLERLNLEAKVARLNGLVAQIGEGYRRGSEKIKKLPVDSSCRVMMEPFAEIYGKEEVEADIAFVKRKEKDWREEGVEKSKPPIGEEFELLKTAIFNKYLGKKFIVVRSSLYDDYKNGVDNVMIDKASGNVVCAFDEVGDESFFKKMKEGRIASKNFEEGGASIKYGIVLRDGRLTAERLENLPIFCLSLSAEAIEEGIQKMEFSRDKKSPIEDKIFEICFQELREQIATLQEKMPAQIAAANTERAEHLKQLSARLKIFEESIF